MPSLKRLNSVAHNVAHQFASTLNYWNDDYAINHLGKAAESIAAQKVLIDLRTGAVSPPEIAKGQMAQILASLAAAFRALLEKEGFSLEQIQAATLRYDYDVKRPKYSNGIYSYECTSSITTTDGKTHEAHLTEKNN